MLETNGQKSTGIQEPCSVDIFVHLDAQPEPNPVSDIKPV